jgi:hypothetical protein
LLNGVDLASCKLTPRLFLASSVNVSVLSLQSVTIDVVLGDARIDRMSCFAASAADGLIRSSWRLTVTHRFTWLLSRPITLVLGRSSIAWTCLAVATRGLGRCIAALRDALLARWLVALMLLMILLLMLSGWGSTVLLSSRITFFESGGQETAIVEALHH